MGDDIYKGRGTEDESDACHDAGDGLSAGGVCRDWRTRARAGEGAFGAGGGRGRVCYAGEVVPYRAQQMSLVGGRADSYALRDTSNVNILYRSARQNSLDAALNTLRKFEKVSNGNVVYQTIDDFLESNISDGLFIPNRDWEIKGDVSKLFDKTVYESLRDFLITVYEKKYIDIRHGLVHAPAAEWIVPQVSVNFNFETDVDGLFVVGDGSGKTQDDASEHDRLHRTAHVRTRAFRG